RCAPRDLLSFPTRRSSDLAHNESAEKIDSLFHKSASFAIYAIIASFVLQFIYAQIWLRIPPDAARLVSYVPTVAIISAIPAGFIDRKSTRLNSSHVKISYA